MRIYQIELSNDIIDISADNIGKLLSILLDMRIDISLIKQITIR